MSDSYKRVVAVCDVIPNDGNPREDFGDIAALGATFAANGGQPYTPIVVVPDGSKFRLADGERRWRAMRELGTERCDALVFPTMGEAEVAVAMMATDDSKALTEAERARGFQTMMALGVDDETLAAAARTDARTVRRVRRVYGGRLPDQATLDAAFAAADDEFTEDERQQILRAGKSAWKGEAEREADRIRKAHERSRRLQAIQDSMPDGVEYRPGSKPYQPERDGLIYLSTARTPEGAAKLAAQHDGADGLVAYEDGIAYALYQTASDDALDPKAVATSKARQFRDEHIAAYEEAYRAMCAYAVAPWVEEGATLGRSRAMMPSPQDRRPDLCGLIEDGRMNAGPFSGVFGKRAEELFGPAAYAARNERPCLLEVCAWLMGRNAPYGLLDYSGTEVDRYYAGRFAEVYDVLVEDGWEPTEGARALRGMCPEEEK